MWVILSDGRRYEGDMLIGADGIWSKVNPSTHSLPYQAFDTHTMKMLYHLRNSHFQRCETRYDGQIHVHACRYEQS